MDSDLNRHHNYLHRQQPPQQTTNSGLTRYRSAPSSYFSDLIDNGLFGDDDSNPFVNPRVSNAAQTADQANFMRFNGGDSTIVNQIGEFEPQFMDSVKQEQDGGMFSDAQQPLIYQNQFQSQSQMDHDNNHQSVSTCSSTIDDSLTNMNLPANLLRRQSSSPAGFLAQLDMDHGGYSLMRSMDDFRASRGNVPSSMMTTSKRLKNEIGFTSGSQSSSGILPRIPENEAKVMEMKSSLNDGGFGSNGWDDSDILCESFLNEFGDSDQNKISNLNSSGNQSNDVGRIRGPTTLIHHLSMPASTAELDKLMQFQDSVPLKSRAKRGCATHPRSIAERVRRTRISERMRRLQDLVPNMDKQTNTADMLDFAVDYIKELQKEAETLSDHHAKCSCPHKQKL
ncbi:hypothetical protein SSX86_000734 [Deinandra increscens subsp. villosa]|uniref:BHLH domain-containing protein n=1 Tax=Deinandra increscens subsp. villosa TaxID=3103831 RepID=A0AAP0HA71_9ASTR